jgi:hypothetical protein
VVGAARSVEDRPIPVRGSSCLRRRRRRKRHPLVLDASSQPLDLAEHPHPPGPFPVRTHAEWRICSSAGGGSSGVT